MLGNKWLLCCCCCCSRVKLWARFFCHMCPDVGLFGHQWNQWYRSLSRKRKWRQLVYLLIPVFGFGQPWRDFVYFTPLSDLKHSTHSHAALSLACPLCEPYRYAEAFAASARAGSQSGRRAPPSPAGTLRTLFLHFMPFDWLETSTANTLGADPRLFHHQSLKLILLLEANMGRWSVSFQFLFWLCCGPCAAYCRW